VQGQIKLCTKVPQSVVMFFKRQQKRKEDDTFNRRQRRSFVSASATFGLGALAPAGPSPTTPAPAPSPAAPAPSSVSANAAAVDPTPAPAPRGSIVAFLDTEARRQLNMGIARFFFETGTPFNVADSPAFKDLMQAVITWARDYSRVAYSPPSSHPLRTSLLDACDLDVQQKIQVRLNCCCLS